MKSSTSRRMSVGPPTPLHPAEPQPSPPHPMPVRHKVIINPKRRSVIRRGGSMTPQLAIDASTAPIDRALD